MPEQQSPEPIVEDWAARLDEYHRRMGRFIAQAAAADAELTNIIARITSKADRQRVELLVLDRLPSVKLQVLKDVLPAADVLRKEELWVGGKELCTAIGAVNTHRNALAHSMIRLNIERVGEPTKWLDPVAAELETEDCESHQVFGAVPRGCEMPGKPFRCRVGMHKWVVRREPDREPYFECARCSKVQVTEVPPILM